MQEQRGVVREIAWREVFPWLNLVRALRLAMQARMLLVAAIAVLATMFGWWLAALLFEAADERPLADWTLAYQSCPWIDASGPEDVSPTPLRAPDGLGNADNWLTAPPHLGRYPSDPLLGPWHQLSAPARQLFDLTLTYRGLAFLLLCLLWAAAVWALFGGALTRMAAVQLAREENIGLKPALRYAAGKWRSYLAAPLFPLLGVLLCVLPMLVVGLLMRADAGLLVAAIVWPLMLLGGLLMAILLLGLLFGWPLMAATISAEGTDSFDALGRAYSYVYHRPLHYLFYAAVAVLLGGLAWLLVIYFAEAVIYLPQWAASWGSGNERIAGVRAGVGPSAPEGVGEWGARLIEFWAGCVRVVALGFAYSYFWTASTAMYFLLRRDDDGTEMDEVHVEGGEAYALPPLATDAAGVSVVDPAEANVEQEIQKEEG
ncbi:MAG: hypothetical protein WD403_08630 [Pirellulales bacterium]